MNEPQLVPLNASVGATAIKCGTIIALVGIVFLYSWKTGNPPKFETEKFSLIF